MKILALDPGVTTGLCYADVTAETVRLTVDQRKLNESDMTLLLQDLQGDLDVIVCEDFKYRKHARAKLDLTPMRMIGVVNLFVQQRGVDLYMQQPADAKTYFTNRYLRTHGLWVAGLDHGRDALRHFLRWFTFGPGYQYNSDQEIKVI